MQVLDSLGEASPGQLVHTVNLKLAALGCAPVESRSEDEFHEIARAILGQSEEPGAQIAPVDGRIEAFLDRMLGQGKVKLPTRTLVLDRAGLARALSVPVDGEEFSSDILNSYWVRNGVLHNPKSDRRTTEGIFHVVEGGLSIRDDKKAVPKEVFANLFDRAVQPPKGFVLLPFTAKQSSPAECIVSLLLRPIVCPSVPGIT